VIGADPHLVAPIDAGTLFLGLLADCWILFVQPALNCLGILHNIGTTEGLLRGKPPTTEIATDCPPVPSRFLKQKSGPIPGNSVLSMISAAGGEYLQQKAGKFSGSAKWKVPSAR
jgi:hypothetical protein